jgi:hypothetical protein
VYRAIVDGSSNGPQVRSKIKLWWLGRTAYEI